MPKEVEIYGKLPIKIILDKRMTLNDLRVISALSSFQGGKKNCFPSLRAISERSGVHSRHISKHTKRLERFGYLKITRRGKRISNLYTVGDYTKSVESQRGSDYTPRVESDYTARGVHDSTARGVHDSTARGESNIKRSLKSTNKRTPGPGKKIEASGASFSSPVQEPTAEERKAELEEVERLCRDAGERLEAESIETRKHKKRFFTLNAGII